VRFIQRVIDLFFNFCVVQRIAGEIKDFSTEGYVAPKFARRMDKFMLYMLTAGKKAIEDAGITDEVMNGLDKSKCGVLIGSAMGGMQVLLDGQSACLRVGLNFMVTTLENCLWLSVNNSSLMRVPCCH
jgi:3-oxoacyl-(acyl-carrier-protein) synthase